MRLTRTIALSILSIALTAIMFAAGPILAEHQVFAYHIPHYPNNLGGVVYGPCLQEHKQFMYDWCVRP
jgi:hypothetical protein